MNEHSMETTIALKKTKVTLRGRQRILTNISDLGGGVLMEERETETGTAIMSSNSGKEDTGNGF